MISIGNTQSWKGYAKEWQVSSTGNGLISSGEWIWNMNMNIMEGCSKVNRVGMNKDLNKGYRYREGGLNGKAF